MDNKSFATQPIIIVGCQRSGTTLLRTILGGHPQLLEHPQEPQFILEMFERFGFQVRDIKKAVAYLLKHPYLPTTVQPGILWQAYKNESDLSLQDFFQRYLHVWAGERLFTQRPVLKHPALIYHLDLVAALFPQATILHIIRDPRANISSQKARWMLHHTWESAMLWKKAIQTGKKWGSNNRLSLLEVNYERILLHPEEEITLLCQHLEIPFLPEMLTFNEETTDYIPGAPPKQVKFNTVDFSRLDQWKERLSPLEIRLIEYSCKTEMVACGYEFTHPLVPNGQFYWRLFYERFLFLLRMNGRRLKNLVRRTGWRLGIRLLQVPPK